MNLDDFAVEGYKVIDFIVDYQESLSQRPVAPNVSPGFLKSVLPSTPPKTGAPFTEILEDFEKYILPGILHWQHPGFHAYLPGCTSYTATLGSMLGDILGNVGFDWTLSPSGTELEMISVDWYGKLIGLPRCFLQRETTTNGGGVLLKSTNECIFIALITARRNILRKLVNQNPALSVAMLLSSLVAYCSKEAYSNFGRHALVVMVNVRVLETEADHRLIGKTIDKAIEEDKAIGLIPFFVNITLGTASCGSCDPVKEIGSVCQKHGVWLHVDASYAGNAMVCPEFQHFFEGIEYASSVNSNPADWLMVHFDCAVMFVKDRSKVNDAMIVDRTTFGYSFVELDWGYPCKTEFKAIKFWFVLRNYGAKGLRNHIRNHVRLAKMFADFVRDDNRFEIISCNFGIVCFRLKGCDELNQKLKKKVNFTGKLFLSPCYLSEKYVIRFVLVRELATEDDMKYAWKIICEQSEIVLKEHPEANFPTPIEVYENYHRYSL